MLALFLSSSSSYPTLTFLSRSVARRATLSSLTMSTNLRRTTTHAYAGNPLKSKPPKSTDSFSPSSAFDSLKSLIPQIPNHHTATPPSPDFRVLPFSKGRPLVFSTGGGGGDASSSPIWHLGWISLADCKGMLSSRGVDLDENSLVYLGPKVEEDLVCWAVDVSEEEDGVVLVFESRKLCFVELRTLMVAADWVDQRAMDELAIAGHARALLEWHRVSRFCGACGGSNVPKEAGRRKQCSNEACGKRVYPRVDPVVIMLVIDRENDSALLSRQSRYVPRMWSCLAGFIEPGESLEEAVRRETWEETGIEVGDVVYHSSQPWPVGPSSMPCQLMLGFFAFAKTFDINVDKEELEDAQWHSREDVKKALAFANDPRVSWANNNTTNPHHQAAYGLINNFSNNINSRPLSKTTQNSFATTPQIISTRVEDKAKNQKTRGQSESLKRAKYNEPASKKQRVSTPSPLPTFKVRKENLRDQITSLQQLVSPFGKTDTASVLQEAIEYIKFLHDQVTVLSTPYMKQGAPIHQQQQDGNENQELRAHGLCLVPISSTFPVANETTANFWTPTFGGNNFR